MYLSQPKIQYDSSMGLVLKKIDEYQKMNPTQNITMDIIKSIMDDVEKNKKNESPNVVDKELQQKLHHDFCDMFDT
jgi:hypothetical protein